VYSAVTLVEYAYQANAPDNEPAKDKTTPEINARDKYVLILFFISLNLKLQNNI
jgi:hypothetical protein